MAEEIVSNKMQTPEEVAAANAEAIRKQAAQDLAGHSNAPSFDKSTVDSLDELRAKIVAEKNAAEPAEVAAKAEADKKAADEAKAAEDAKALAAKAEAGDADAALEVQKQAEARKLADAAAAKASEDAAALKTKADELFKDAPTLAPNASPKSAEAFSQIKARAAQEINTRDAKIAALEAEKAELSAKANLPVPAEVTKELESLREFRARLDIEADPKFKTFDTEISKTAEFIYTQLKRSDKITPKIIEDIKALGGPQNVAMEPILALVNDATTRRIIESKLAEVEMTAYNKTQAIEAAKANVKKFQEEREKEWSGAATSHNDATKAQLEAIAAKVSWLQEVKPDPKATDKAAAEAAAKAHNETAKRFRGELDLAIQDDSPNMRATLMLGMVQLFRLQAVHEATVKNAARLEASLAEATKTMDRLKAAGASRLRTSGAPEGGHITAASKNLDYNEKAGDAMDRLRAERARAQAAA